MACADTWHRHGIRNTLHGARDVARPRGQKRAVRKAQGRSESLAGGERGLCTGGGAMGVVRGAAVGVAPLPELAAQPEGHGPLDVSRGHKRPSVP